jgi:hypothetical protein
VIIRDQLAGSSLHRLVTIRSGQQGEQTMSSVSLSCDSWNAAEDALVRSAQRIELVANRGNPPLPQPVRPDTPDLDLFLPLFLP